jgi:hypothetical protein
VGRILFGPGGLHVSRSGRTGRATTEETTMSSLLARNVGTADRVVRVVVGLGLLALTVAGPHTLWGLLGLVLLATAAIGSCPLYSLLGLRTCPASPRGA